MVAKSPFVDIPPTQARITLPNGQTWEAPAIEIDPEVSEYLDLDCIGWSDMWLTNEDGSVRRIAIDWTKAKLIEDDD